MSLARAEIGLIRSLGWAVRGRRAVAPEDVALPYADRFLVMLWAVCCLGALELVVVHVVTPWPVARWIFFGIGVYALLWFVGFGLSLRQHPHVVRRDDLLLRFGHFRTTRVPLDDVASVRTRVTSGHKRNVVLDDSGLALPVMGDTNVELRFDPPIAVEVTGEVRSLSRILFYADDPRDAVGRLSAGTLSPGR